MLKPKANGQSIKKQKKNGSIAIEPVSVSPQGLKGKGKQKKQEKQTLAEKKKKLKMTAKEKKKNA